MEQVLPKKISIEKPRPGDGVEGCGVENGMAVLVSRDGRRKQSRGRSAKLCTRTGWTRQGLALAGSGVKFPTTERDVGLAAAARHGSQLLLCSALNELCTSAPGLVAAWCTLLQVLLARVGVRSRERHDRRTAKGPLVRQTR